MSGSVKITLNSTSQILMARGLDSSGAAQRFHTQNCLNRMIKFMPFRSGAMSTKLTRIVSNTEIETAGPYAKYQFYGKAMEGKAPKMVTDRDLVYSKNKNPNAGPYWDRALMAAEGKAIKADLQRFINRGG